MFLVVLYFYWLCLSGPIRFTHFTVLRIFLNKCMVAVSVWHSFPANYAETWICPKHVCVFCFPLLVFAVAFTCFLPPPSPSFSFSLCEYVFYRYLLWTKSVRTLIWYFRRSMLKYHWLNVTSSPRILILRRII